MNEITRIPTEIESSKTSVEQLLPEIYDQLRALAAENLDWEKPDQILQPTALVHEAFIRLIRGQRDRHWNGPNHFFMAAAETMRRILVDNARRKRALRAGGAWQRVPLSDVATESHGSRLDVLALHEALDRLNEIAPRKADLVKLRFFAGLTLDQAAAVLRIAPSTADKDWAYAKSWLRVALSEENVEHGERLESPRRRGVLQIDENSPEQPEVIYFRAARRSGTDAHHR